MITDIDPVMASSLVGGAVGYYYSKEPKLYGAALASFGFGVLGHLIFGE